MIELSDLGIVVAVSDDSVLNNNLLRSKTHQRSLVPIFEVRGALSASLAYNEGLTFFSNKKAIIFVHQDVYLPEAWIDNLLLQIQTLKPSAWGVLGVFGKNKQGMEIGQVWDSGLNRELGKRFRTPTPVETLDELLLVVNNEKELKFDPELPGFHLYGTDICAISRSSGLENYAIYAPVVHNSKRVNSLGGSYAKAYGYMRKKWRSQLPLYAVCSKITFLSVEYHRIRFGLAYRRVLGLLPIRKNSSKNPKTIAKSMGYE